MKKLLLIIVVVLIAAVVLIAIVGESPAPYGEGMTVYFFNVGQGDAALAVSEDAVILFDAGTNESEERLIAYIERLGIERIDCAVFSHPHDDHIGGADAVFETFEVGSVVMPDIYSDEKCYEDLSDAIRSELCKVYEARAGEAFEYGVVKLSVLSPETEFGDPNLDSAVVKLEYKDVSFLFTGDCEGDAEAALIENAADMLDCDVLKVGHHGSANATTDEFLDHVTPTLAVISCGVDNEYGHPRTETLQRIHAHGVKVARTDKMGMITVLTDGESVWMKER